jgi:hypothetical protein
VAHDGGGKPRIIGRSCSVDKELIATRSLTSAVKATRATNDRYLLGRQFMVVVMVFTITHLRGPADATLWGF